MLDESNDNETTRPLRLSKLEPVGEPGQNEEETTRPVHLAKPEPTAEAAGGMEPTQPVRLDKLAPAIGNAPPPQPLVLVRPEEIIQPEIHQDAPPPAPPFNDSPTPAQPAPKPKKRGHGWLIFGGIILVLLAGALGSYQGYLDAVRVRGNIQSSQTVMAAAEQFQRGLDDMNNQRYDMARERFEYVIKLDPNFPGVKEKLTEVMVAMQPTEVVIPTITLTPTPVYTPTPDLRGEEELFNQIQALLTDKKWDTATQVIEALRSKNLKYKTVDVDGYYYIALRYRGLNKIALGDLEGGMYDLALAERFGPLDRDADSYRLWARYYVIGASFWQVDWEKATFYFGQVAPSLPNMRDYSNVTAIERYREAASRYAEKLSKDGDHCKASKILDTVFVSNYRNPTFEALATRVWLECNPATETPQASKTATSTPTITVTPSRTSLTPFGPTFTPSFTPTPSRTGVAASPTITNTPAPATATFTPTPTVKAQLPSPTFTFTPTPTVKP